MNGLYKTLVIEKLSKFVCYIRYKNGMAAFEKPFRISDNREPVELFNSNYITVTDCVSNNVVQLYFDDILMFHIDYEDNPQESEQDLKKKLDEYQTLFSKFEFLRGRRLQDLFFRKDIEELQEIRIRNLRILDKLHLDDLDDYTKLQRSDKEVLDKLKEFWKNLMLVKYNDTIRSIDEEINGASDESIISELNTIKGILGSIPAEIDEQLVTKTTYEEVLTYWPTLLLPRSDIFDVS